VFNYTCLNKVKNLKRKKIKSVSHLSREVMLPIQPAVLEQEENRFALFLAAHRIAEGWSVLFQHITQAELFNTI